MVHAITSPSIRASMSAACAASALEQILSLNNSANLIPNLPVLGKHLIESSGIGTENLNCASEQTIFRSRQPSS